MDKETYEALKRLLEHYTKEVIVNPNTKEYEDLQTVLSLLDEWKDDN